MTDPPFRRVARVDGYLPIADHGLVGDGATAALVGRDGGVSWLCAPRFDSPPLFCGILDARRGGTIRVAPAELVESRQYYDGETAVLVTEMRAPGGVLRVTDALGLRSGADLHEDAPAGRGELIRRIEVPHGELDVVVDVRPYGECELAPRAEGLAIELAERPELDVLVAASFRLEGHETSLHLRKGAREHLVVRWCSGTYRHGRDVDVTLDATRDAWRRWVDDVEYDGPLAPTVRRSAITLKLLDHFANGALVAAPTSSLPEKIGGGRNWDYRFSWVRDAAFCVYALRRVGLPSEAWGFLGWVLDAVQRSDGACVLYDIDGRVPGEEREAPDLEGYRGSAPVRWGNGAAAQTQHDALGEIVDCAYQWARAGGEISEELWARLADLVEEAAHVWSTPDHGIWEVRSAARTFTYSAAMCQVALDRGAKLVRDFKLPGDADAWEKESERIRNAIVEDSWDEKRRSFTEHVGDGGGLDASLLTLPLRRVLPADHPRMVATTEAVTRELGAGDGLLYRYLPSQSPDGLEGDEGAFLLCSFWLVDNLALQGRVDEALELFESLCARGGHLGLLPEQIDPDDGSFLGNYPQAFSHVGIVGSAVALRRAGANR